MRKFMLLAAASMAVGAMSAVERQNGRYMRAPEGHGGRPASQVNLQALRDARAEKIAAMQALINAAEGENRDLTAEEQGQFDTIKAEADGLGTRIDRAATLAETVAGLSASTGAVSRRSAPGRGAEATTQFETVGHFLSAVRFNPNDQRLNYVEGIGSAEEGGEIGAEMRMDNAPAGGFMVPTEFRDTIMQVKPEDALVRPRATVLEPGTQPDAGVTMPGLDQTGDGPGSMYGGMQFSWIGEGDYKPETNTKLSEISLTPHEIAGHVTVTDKLLRNWQSAGPFLETLMRSGIAAAEDAAFIAGDGVQKPLGAVNSPAMLYVHRTTAGAVKYLDLVNMVARLLMRGGQEPVWSMSQELLPQLATMTDPQGRYIWQASAVPGIAGTLLGYPVRWNNRSARLGTRGDVVLADWSQYLIKDGSGPFVAASEHVLFLRNKTVIKIFWNVDGAPWQRAPIREENGLLVSAFVGLDVPA